MWCTPRWPLCTEPIIMNFNQGLKANAKNKLEYFRLHSSGVNRAARFRALSAVRLQRTKICRYTLVWWQVAGRVCFCSGRRRSHTSGEIVLSHFHPATSSGTFTFIDRSVWSSVRQAGGSPARDRKTARKKVRRERKPLSCAVTVWGGVFGRGVVHSCQLKWKKKGF